MQTILFQFRLLALLTSPLPAAGTFPDLHSAVTVRPAVASAHVPACERLQIEGWNVHVRREWIESEVMLTARARELVRKQKEHDPEMFAWLGKPGETDQQARSDSGSEKTPVTARPGGLMADSPVTFPKEGALPAQYPPDVRVQNEPAEQDYYIFSSPCRSLSQIAAIQTDMPPGHFTPPPADWKHLQRTRRILLEGGELRLLALGDSIVNDTMRSGWVAQLREAYPKARIEAAVYVRGGGGCQHYREEDRVEKWILPRKPDLVFIGGISQRDIESIREVIRRLRAAVPGVEILLASGTFGTVDPRDAAALARAPHSGTGDYGRALQSLAAEQHCAYLDMTGPWAEYLRSAKVHPHLFYRDPVHANEFGEQILARILMAFWTAPEETESAGRIAFPNDVKPQL
jgi:hypothetical protein